MIERVSLIEFPSTNLSAGISKEVLKDVRARNATVVVEGLRQGHHFSDGLVVSLVGFSKDRNAVLSSSFAIFQMDIGGITLMQLVLLPRYSLLGTVPGLDVLNSCPY